MAVNTRGRYYVPPQHESQLMSFCGEGAERVFTACELCIILSFDFWNCMMLSLKSATRMAANLRQSKGFLDVALVWNNPKYKKT